VFFSTTEGLDPADTDESYDVYDARVGGGFAKADVAAPCDGDSCQGPPSGGPSLAVSGSTSLFGAGNALPSSTGTTAAARLKLGTRKVSRNSLRVRATVTGPGRVGLTGSTVRATRKSYATKGTFTLSAPLTAKARQSLKSKRKLKLTVRLVFTPRSGAASSVKFVLNAKA
jgi:hypothetical protein